MRLAKSREARAALAVREAVVSLWRIQRSARERSAVVLVVVGLGMKAGPSLPRTYLVAWKILLQKRRLAWMSLTSKLMSPPACC